MVNAGTAKLIGTDIDKIVNEANLLLTNKLHYEKMLHKSDIYGDGEASNRIVDVCSKYLFKNNDKNIVKVFMKFIFSILAFL